MDIQETRRSNLATWLRTHSVPPAEKSLFSQLKAGGSFGERLARRLERDYGMDAGFLDNAQTIDSPNTWHNTPLSGEAKTLIRLVERIDGLGDPTRKIISHVASILEIADSLNQSHNQYAEPVPLSDAEEILNAARRPESHGVPKHATTKGRTKR